MKMLSIAALAVVATSSAAFAQADPAATPAPAVTTRTATVHTHTVTHHDGKRHPQLHKVVHRSTVVTPNGVATQTSTATTKTTPR